MKNYKASKPAYNISMTDKQHAAAVAALDYAQNKAREHVFYDVAEIIAAVQKLAAKHDLDLREKVDFVFHVYETSDNYARSCKWRMQCTRAFVIVNGGHVTNFKAHRMTTAESYVYLAGAALRYWLDKQIDPTYVYIDDNKKAYAAALDAMTCAVKDKVLR